MKTNLWARTHSTAWLALAVLIAPACAKSASAPAAEAAEHADHAGEAHADDHAEEKRDDPAHRDHVHLSGDATLPAAPSPLEATPTDEENAEVAAVHSSEITTELLVRQLLVPTLGVPGRVEFDGDAVAQVGSPVKGRVVDLPVALGQIVSAGQALLTIESPEYGEAQSELLQRRSALRAASPGLSVARSSFARAKALYDESRGIALTEVERREADLRAAESALTLAQAGVAAAEAKLKLMGMAPEELARLVSRGQVDPRHELRAPVAGTVIERRAVRGQLVGPEDPALLVVADPLRLWLTAAVPEAAASGMRVQGKAAVRTSRDAEDSIPAQILVVAAAVDPATRTLQVRLATRLGADQAHLLRPGMFVWVDMELAGDARTPQNAVLAVPASAVVDHEGQTQVFVEVPGEAHAYVPRVVRVGPVVGSKRQLLAGLREGERVVVRGAFLLKAEAGKSEAGHED